MRIVKRLYSAWRRHSLGTLIQLIVKNIFYYLKELLSGRLFGESEEKKSEFDGTYGTDTEKIREIGSLDIASQNAQHAVRYQPSPQNFAAELIHALPIDYSQFIFIDFGAGKGRVLLIAAQLPFAAVIGIEFSQELCAVAIDNISKIVPNKRAGRVECYYNDVTLYPLPESPLVCYFYNPFDRLIMQAVVDRLASSLKDKPREIYIIYVHPEHRAIFDAEAYWDAIDESSLHVIYHSRLDKLLEHMR
jgi:SAM-dependent methyltransferase